MTRPADIARALFVLTGAIAQVVFGALPFILELDHSIGSRSAQVQTLLTPAGYAFSIWGVLFFGCGIYAAAHLFRLSDPVMRRTGWFAGAAFWLNTAWETWVPFFGIEIVSLVLILGCWLTCLAFILIGSADREAGLFGRAARLPVYALGGWLNAAAAVNLLVVLEVYGAPFLGSGEPAAALVVLIAALIAAAAVILPTGSLSYALALAWGLGGIYVENEFSGEPLISYAAAGGAALLAFVVIFGWIGRVQRRSNQAARPSQAKTT